MKLLYVGSRSAQSAASLAALLAQNVVPDRVFVDAPADQRSAMAGQLPPLITAGDQQGILALAARHGIAASSGAPRCLQEVVRECRPEQVLVSCYPYRISSRLLADVPLGWLNIHPSLLPEYRGVNPIFWQLRDGHAYIGVSLHRMNRWLDQGPIIDQGTVSLADFPDYAEISRRVGRQGAQLFLEYRENQCRGWVVESAQDCSAASHQGYPQRADFTVDPAWSVRRMVRFIKGVRTLGPPFLSVAGRSLLISDAMIIGNERPPVLSSGERLIHCYDGSVILQISSEEPR